MKWITEVMEENRRRKQKESLRNHYKKLFNKDTMIKDENGFPRRSRLDLNQPAELAISNAIDEIEKLGADVLLTEAQILLQKAKEKVSDYLESCMCAGKVEND